jgi:hypothetical protein
MFYLVPLILGILAAPVLVGVAVLHLLWQMGREILAHARRAD